MDFAPRAPHDDWEHASEETGRRPAYLATDNERDDPFGTTQPRSNQVRRPMSSATAGASWSGASRPAVPAIPPAPASRPRGWSRSLPVRRPRGRQVPATVSDEYPTSAPRPRRTREHSVARPLSALPEEQRNALQLAAMDRPMAVAPRFPMALRRVAHTAPAILPGKGLPARARVRVDTRAIVQSAASPWNGARFVLALLALAMALVTAHAHMGEPSQPLMMHWTAGLGSSDAATIASKVRPETQIVQSELYDSYQQFLDWKGAACSAAATSEILTAWGAKGATIGRVIDLMGNDISQNGGLISEDGFQRAVSHYGYRSDIRHDLSYKQILYLANDLGVPVIVNVRISYGYYHFFDTGHFLVVTGGDDQGVTIIDSSTYYIHYLPLGVFFSMFTGRTALIVPNDYHYTLPAK